MISKAELAKRGGKVKVIPLPEPAAIPTTEAQEHVVTIDTEKLESLIATLAQQSAKPQAIKTETGLSKIQLERIIQSMPKDRELKPFEARIIRDERGTMMGAKFYPVDK